MTHTTNVEAEKLEQYNLWAQYERRHHYLFMEYEAQVNPHWKEFCLKIEKQMLATNNTYDKYNSPAWDTYNTNTAQELLEYRRQTTLLLSRLISIGYKP